MYKIEMHFHTSETSRCGQISAADGIRAYAGAGYHGVVVTDHLMSDYFGGTTPDPEEAVVHLTGWRKAKEAGEQCGVRVYLGCEIRFDGDPSDFLVYGATEEWFLRTAVRPGLFTMGAGKFRDLIREEGMLLFQAHPFRGQCRRADPADIDGVEVGNFSPGEVSRNHLAEPFARKYGLLRSTGSDFHEMTDLGLGGITCDRLPEDEKDLCRILKSGAYGLIGEENIFKYAGDEAPGNGEAAAK